MLQSCFSVSPQEESRLLPQVKQEQAERGDCSLDLKVEVNVSSECSLSSGECLHLQMSGGVHPPRTVTRAELDQRPGCHGNSTGYCRCVLACVLKNRTLVWFEGF